MKSLRWLFCLVFISLLLTACVKSGGNSDEMTKSAVRPTAEPFFSQAYRQILIPDGLSFDSKQSTFVETKSFSGGVLRYTGRIEVTSLAEFFRNTMPKNKWQQVYLGTGLPMLQAYIRNGKTCMIRISESTFTTLVDIYITDSHEPVN